MISNNIHLHSVEATLFCTIQKTNFFLRKKFFPTLTAHEENITFWYLILPTL